MLELTQHRMAVCQLVQIVAPPWEQQEGVAGLSFPFESVAHNNSLGLLLFSLQVRTCDLLSAAVGNEVQPYS